MHVIAVVDSLILIVNRYGMKEIIHLKVHPGLMYRKLMFKRVVSKLIRVVVRISVQDLYGRVLTQVRVDAANQSFRRVS